MSRRIVITGGAGFIGSNLVEYLNRHSPDWFVVVVDDLSTGLETNLRDSRSQLIRQSILDLDSLVEITRECDAIIHLAALGSVPRSIKTPIETNDVNIRGTLNVLESARVNSIHQVIVASSSSVYGSNPNLPRQEFDWTRPMSPYAVSKLATEAYAGAYRASYGLKTLALRFFNVYGPNQRADHPYAAVIPRFLSAALTGNPITIYGDGEQTRDFTFVESVCEALHYAILHSVESEHPVNLAFGSRTTVNTLVGHVETALGHSLTVERTENRKGDVRQSQAETTLMKSLFPESNPTAIQAGIRRTLDWFRSEMT